MKWVSLILLVLTILSFGGAGWIMSTAQVADEKMAALFPFMFGCVFGVTFLILMIVRAIIY